ncbi:MAG: hypothetical protein IJC94_08200 [Oscillospiraceae bacterium]|nr:hypothetical protein [Oscillospiraceae bacterium]
MKKLIENTREHSIEHGPIPFWSWNSKLEPQELRRQLRNMRSLHMNGAFMHARTGLSTEYLSEDWYNCIRACVDEAEKLGMEAWCYDENGWPSGFGGGELLEDPENWATFIGLEESDRYPDAPSGDPTHKVGEIGKGDPILGVYVIRDGKCIKVEGDCGADKYYVVRQGFDPSYVDTLNAAITRKFIAHTYETYKEKVGISENMPGFFTDEPQYYRYEVPWSTLLPAEFEKRYGLNIFDELAAMFIDFDGAEVFRYRYHKMVHQLFINGFAKEIYEWCEKNGAQLTGHAVEEFSLSGQMLCCGGVMPFYEYEHIPGIDYLGCNLVNDMGPRQLGSVCAQLGKKKAITENFACCGWDVLPNEIKNIAELQYAGGVNMMCHHLYPYTVKGQCKRDYPAFYSEHLPWQQGLAEFNEYFNHLGYILAQGEEMVDTLVIHPMHSAWLWYKKDCDWGVISQSMLELENSTSGLLELLGEYQVPYHFGDEWMMSRHAKVEGAAIRVGNCSYSKIVVPICDTLDASTVEFLREFIANGGKVWLYGKAPDRIDGELADMSWLRSNCDFEEIKSACAVKVRHSETPNLPVPEVKMMLRSTEEGKIVYLTSLTKSSLKNVSVTLKGFKGVSELDILTLEKRPISGKRVGNDIVVTLNFEDSESHMLIETDDEPAAPVFCRKRDIALGSFEIAEKIENVITLDRACVKLNDGEWSEERPIERIRDELLRARFKGDVSLKYIFNAEFVPETLRVCVEPMNYSAVSLNGKELPLGQPWWMDRSFLTADIAPFVKVGQNELCVTFSYYQRDYVYHVLYDGVSESLRNCLSFDTEVEAAYIYGDFAVSSKPFTAGENESFCCEGGFSLVPRKSEIDLRNITTDGYPFFAGTVSAKTVVNYKAGGPTVLNLPGRYATCEVYLNGEKITKLMFSRKVDLADKLVEGENELVLKLTNARRNLLGPHHQIKPENFGVSPSSFSFEGKWQDGKCESFRERYAFVRFGIDV